MIAKSLVCILSGFVYLLLCLSSVSAFKPPQPKTVLSAEYLYPRICIPNVEYQTKFQKYTDDIITTRKYPTISEVGDILQSCLFRPSNDKFYANHLWVKHGPILVFFVRGDGKGKEEIILPKNAKIKEVKFVIGKEEHVHPLNHTSSPYIPINIKEIQIFKKASHGTVVTVNIKYENLIESYYFKKIQKFSLYEAFGLQIGLWIPVGLFSLDFAYSPDGLLLANFPVGLAWGARYNFGNEHFNYLGISLFASWSVHPGKKKEIIGTEQDTLNLKGLAIGFLLDLGGWGYLGTALGWDFREGMKNPGISLSDDSKIPGLLFVLGLGPRLVTVFNASEK